MLRVCAVLLVLAAGLSLLEALDSWRGHEALQPELAQSWDELAAMGQSAPYSLFWLSGWPQLLLVLIGITASFMILVAVGLWRLRPGAWLAAIVLVVLMLLQPVREAGVWGVESISHAGWSAWVVTVALSIFLLWFLARRGTRETLGVRMGIPWRSPWTAVAGFFVIVSLVPLGGLVVLKVQTGFPFWQWSGPLEQIAFKPDHRDYREWHQVHLYDSSFAVPRETRLDRFPAEYDAGFGIVVLSAGTGDNRQVILASATSTWNYIPAGTLESSGVSHPLHLARVTLQSNWSFYPVLYRAALIDPTTRAFWLQDDTRKVLVTARPSASREFFHVRFTGKRLASQATGMEINYTVPHDQLKPARVAGLAARIQPETRKEEALPPGTEWAEVQVHLNLLRAYWEGNVEAGIELAEMLLEMEEPRKVAVKQLIEAILVRKPDHSGALAIRTRLDSSGSDQK